MRTLIELLEELLAIATIVIDFQENFPDNEDRANKEIAELTAIRLTLITEEFLETLTVGDPQETQRALIDCFRRLSANGIENKSSVETYALSFILRDVLEESDRLYLLDHCIHAIGEDYRHADTIEESEQAEQTLWHLLRTAIWNESFENFNKLMKLFKTLGLTTKPIDFTKERFNSIDNEEIDPQIFSNGSHKILLALLDDIHGDYRFVSIDQLDMLEFLLREGNIDAHCCRYILNELDNIDFYIRYFFLDAHAIALWDDFELNARDLDIDAAEGFKAAVLSTALRDALRPAFNGYFKNFNTRSVVESCAIIEEMSSPAVGFSRAAELLTKEARDRLLAIARNEEHGIPDIYIDDLINIIAMRFFMQQENHRLQDIANTLLTDLRRFAKHENKNLTEVSNGNISDNFIEAVTDCVEQKRTGVFFANTDFSFYQASNLVKVEQNLPTRPLPYRWISDFLHDHPLFQEWRHTRDSLEIERNLLWRMEVQMKILEPIHAKRNLAFVPWFLNHQLANTHAPVLKSALFEPEVLKEAKKFSGIRNKLSSSR